MARKNLNDVIHGDRAVIRGHSIQPDLGLNVPSVSKGEVVTYSGNWTGSKKAKQDYGFSPSCYEKHPAMKIPGTEFVIYGGSCSTPIVKDAEVYIGFQRGMSFTARHWPWKQGTEIEFPIQDMSIPKSADEFRKLVGWTKKQIEAGKKVHCGCIGGHGRTGMFFAALVSEFGEKDAVNYVRAHYCHKAVESSAQIDFLHKEYGVAKAKGHKEGKSATKSSGVSRSKARFAPLYDAKNIWGKKLEL